MVWVLLAQHRLYTQVFISSGAIFGRVMVQENASARLSNGEETQLLLARCGFAERHAEFCFALDLKQQ